MSTSMMNVTMNVNYIMYKRRIYDIFLWRTPTSPFIGVKHR